MTKKKLRKDCSSAHMYFNSTVQLVIFIKTEILTKWQKIQG